MAGNASSGGRERGEETTVDTHQEVSGGQRRPRCDGCRGFGREGRRIAQRVSVCNRGPAGAPTVNGAPRDRVVDSTAQCFATRAGRASREEIDR